MSHRYIPTGSTAKGGLGTVVFCKDTNLDRKVAVKFLQAIGDHRRLLDELAALQKIRSKHVVEIFDVAYFDPGSQMGIVEEFIDGNSVENLLGNVQADQQFLRLLFQISSGLADIHAVEHVHRDIKPQNMLIDTDGILKIIDFNLARPTDDARTKGFMGTRGYAAPELYAGDDEICFDEKIDVYALSVTAYALLTGPALPSLLRAYPPHPDQWKAAGGGFAGLSSAIDKELVLLLDASLSEDPRMRPMAAEICQRTERLILHGKHRGLFVNEAGQSFELSATQSTVKLEHPSKIGSVVIGYDGFEFRVVAVGGEVWVNNIKIINGITLPGSCVIALGNPTRPARERIFITMDVSHPEVVL